MELFGLLSAMLFNFSGVLTLVKVIRQGHANNIMTATYFYPWWGGCITGSIYAIYLYDILLLVNFGLGALLGTVILLYKIFRKPL